MPFVHRLRIFDSAVQTRHKILRKSDQCLNSQKTVCDKSELPMHTRKMRCLMRKLIIFDNDKRRNERIDGEEVEGEMRECALPFLSLCMGWLEDEDCLGTEKDGGGVEEGVEGEEREGVQEYGGPDYDCKEENASLGYGCCSWKRVLVRYGTRATWR